MAALSLTLPLLLAQLCHSSHKVSPGQGATGRGDHGPNPMLPACRVGSAPPRPSCRQTGKSPHPSPRPALQSSRPPLNSARLHPAASPPPLQPRGDLRASPRGPDNLAWPGPHTRPSPAPGCLLSVGLRGFEQQDAPTPRPLSRAWGLPGSLAWHSPGLWGGGHSPPRSLCSPPHSPHQARLTPAPHATGAGVRRVG